VTKEGKFRT